MPVYQRGDRYIHHIHIPKCGGTSVKLLLEKNGWQKLKIPIASGFSNIRNYFETTQDPVRVSPTKSGELLTSHEHREIWGAWNIDVTNQFAVVRNPYGRFYSHIKQKMSHRSDWQKVKSNLPDNSIICIPPGAIDSILKSTAPGFSKDTKQKDGSIIRWGGLGDEDNHYRPQTSFLGEMTSVFTLESGMKDLEDYLKSQEIISEESKMSIENSHSFPVAITWNSIEFSDVHEKFIERYKSDFETLPYRPIRDLENWNGIV